MDKRVIDLCEVLREVNEVALLEILEITSSEIVDAFYDKIEDKMVKLEGEFLND